ncbi:FhaA domain-containing protein [Arthrobacter sulfonylureivorans]|uniref:FhaA domain-containing protein n=1 Tax=Arthrobacter sulfonylureivorans TaxID=2486855 RepID=UPI0039E3DD71
MGILDSMERGIEKMVRGAFSVGGKGQVQPVEIASRLRRELDNGSITLAQGRTLAPNVFEVRLGDSDYAMAEQWGATLAEELCDVVIRHVNSQKYTLQGPVRVSFAKDAALKGGDFEVQATVVKSDGQQQRPAPRSTPAAPSRQPTQLQAVLEINGQRYSLNAPSIVLGRSSEADIMVDDTGVSRRHLEIRTAGGSAVAVDLGSTNGSYVNGQKIIGQTDLTDGSVITMGRTRITFRLLPTRGGGA